MIRDFQFWPKRRALPFMAIAILTAALAPERSLALAAKKPVAPAAKSSVAPGGPSLLEAFGEWSAYSAASGKAKTCYALGKPRERLPASLKRDPGYVFISNRPGEGVKNEVSIVMGFDVKPDSSPKAEIGAASFEMVAKGANLWVKNAAEEGQFIEALRKGQRLVVKAISKKGNVTTDSYTLAGLLPALDKINKGCQ